MQWKRRSGNVLEGGGACLRIRRPTLHCCTVPVLLELGRGPIAGDALQSLDHDGLVMDLIDVLDRLAARLGQHAEHLKTEEATKHTLVMPIINALGYNVFDPLEVVPEFTADVGIKKGEKVDYAIVMDGKPMILVECKAFGSKLCLNHASQLYRYFSVTDSRFAILTNGVQYWFHTDLESPNKMDDKPFFEFDLSDYDEKSVSEFRKFSKANFDLDNILSNASELKYAKQIGKLIAQELDEPTEEFVKLFTSRVYNGRFTSAVQDQFKVLVGTAFRQFVRDQVNDRLKSALRGSDPERFVTDSTTTADENAGAEEPDADDGVGIVTTPEEIEGFHIVKAILSQQVEPSRIAMRDTKSYCGVLLDDNNRKPICRLRFNYSQKYIGLFDQDKNETRTAIGSPEEIYQFTDQLRQCVSLYTGKPTAAPAPQEQAENGG